MKIKDLKRQLKQESVDFVPDIKDKVYISVGYRKKQKSRAQFRLKPALALMVLFFLSLSLFIKPGAIANSFVIVEINPSIELEVSQDNRVINISPLNTDGYFFLEKLNLTNKSVDEAIVEIVNQASIAGYLSETGGTINVSAVNKNTKTEASLNNIITDTLKKYAPNFIKNDEDVKEEAKENNVSPGRMLIIRRAMEADTTLELEAALKMEVKDLITIMNNNAKGKIEKFEDEYKSNVDRLNNKKEENLKELERRSEEIERKLEELEDLVESGISKTEFESLIKEYFPEFIFDIEDFDDLEDVLEEIEEFYEGYYEFLEDLIEDNHKLQKDIYKNKINENSNNNRDDFSFELELDFPFDKILGRLDDDEADVLKIINQINTLLKNQYPGVNRKIRNLYEDYEDLIEDVSPSFRSSDIVREFEENYRKYNN